jgi:hypothetical protein
VKRYVVVVSLLLCCLFFGACGGDTPAPKRGDIAEYLKETYNITEFQITESGTTPQFDLSGGHYADHGYVAVEVGGVVFHVTNGNTFGGLGSGIKMYDDYLAIVKGEGDLGEYVSALYGELPDGTTFSANWGSATTAHPKKFPISFEELAAYDNHKNLNVVFHCDNSAALNENADALCALEEKADIMVRTHFRIESAGQDIYRLKDGRLVNTTDDFSTEKLPYIDYPYLEDAELRLIYETKPPEYNFNVELYSTYEEYEKLSDEYEEKFDKRAKVIEKALEEIGYY